MSYQWFLISKHANILPLPQPTTLPLSISSPAIPLCPSTTSPLILVHTAFPLDEYVWFCWTVFAFRVLGGCLKVPASFHVSGTVNTYLLGPKLINAMYQNKCISQNNLEYHACIRPTKKMKKLYLKVGRPLVHTQYSADRQAVCTRNGHFGASAWKRVCFGAALRKKILIKYKNQVVI
jgi:hypothetical protein